MLLEGRRLIERGTRWLLRNRRRPLDIAATVEHFAPGAAMLYESLPRLLDPDDAEPLAAGPTSCARPACPSELATRVGALPTMFSAFDIVEVADESGLDVEAVAAVHFRLGSAAASCTGCATGSSRCRARTAGALARAALRDDLYTLHRAADRRGAARPARAWRPRRSAWRPGSRRNPPRSATCRRWPTSARAACST